MTFAAGQKITAVDLNELIIIDTGWIAVVFENSWVNYGSGFEEAAYRKIGDRVQLRGLVKSGTVGAAIFTLPVGFRPAGQNIFAIQANEIGKRLDVSSIGGVSVVASATNGYVSLSGVTFIADL